MLLHQKNSYKLIDWPVAKVWKEKRPEGKKNKARHKQLSDLKWFENEEKEES